MQRGHGIGKSGGQASLGSKELLSKFEKISSERLRAAWSVSFPCLKPTLCLDAPQKLEFFRSLSITSILGPMHEVVNVGKK
jgi:hypothetical protein